MKKRLFAALLCAAMSVSLMASCGNGGSSSSSSSSAGSDSSAENDLRESQLVTLDVVTMSSGKNEPDIGMVEDEMNKILEEKFNCNVNLTFISYANYVEQTSLMLSSGQDADLLAIYMVPLPTCANAGQIIPLDDLLDKYGQGIKEQLGDYVKCGQVGDSIYGVTTARDLANSQGFAYIKSVADEVGFDASSIKTLDDLERELLKVKNGKENMWPVAGSAGENIRNWGWDPLGDDTVNLGVLADMAIDPTVVNLYETDQYKDLAKTMYSWMQEGLIQADATWLPSTMIAVWAAAAASACATRTPSSPAMTPKTPPLWAMRLPAWTSSPLWAAPTTSPGPPGPSPAAARTPRRP